MYVYESQTIRVFILEQFTTVFFYMHTITLYKEYRCEGEMCLNQHILNHGEGWCGDEFWEWGMPFLVRMSIGNYPDII